MKESRAKRVPKHKHLLLDQQKIEKTQKALGARTETETIERALEIVIGEEKKNRRAWERPGNWSRMEFKSKTCLAVLMRSS